MIQEEKEALIIKDLCARLPYHIKGNFNGDIVDIISVGIRDTFNSVQIVKDAYTDRTSWENINNIKPYLRPMSSMTEEERKEATQFEINNLGPIGCNWNLLVSNSSKLVDWLLVHHFDYRGLIPMGLAMEAPRDMYKEN